MNNEQVDKRIEQAALGQEALHALDTVAPVLDSQEESVIGRTLAAVSKGELSADGAMSAWMEIQAIRATRKSLMGQIRAGRAASRAVKDEMDQRIKVEGHEKYPHA